MTEPTFARTFVLQRDFDVSGVSGTGTVADGVEFPDGSVAIRWRGERPSTVVWASLTDALHVHGHGGATRVVWSGQQLAGGECGCIPVEYGDGADPNNCRTHGPYDAVDVRRERYAAALFEFVNGAYAWSACDDKESWLAEADAAMAVADEECSTFRALAKVRGEKRDALAAEITRLRSTIDQMMSAAAERYGDQQTILAVRSALDGTP